MTASGAADGSCHVRLPFLLVLGNEVVEESRQPADELAGLPPFVHELDDGGILSRQGLEVRNEVRIGQKPHVKHKIGRTRHSELETEAYEKNQEASLLLSKQRVGVLSQFVDRQGRGIENLIGQFTDWGEKLSFLGDGLAHRPVGIERMGASRLTEAPDEGRLGSLQKPQGNLQAFLLFQLAIDGG